MTDQNYDQYAVAASFNVGKLPEWISFEEGATIGVGCVAAAETLFYGLRIPLPFRIDQESPAVAKSAPPDEAKKPWILVWGGACVTGIMVTQLARQNGFNVLSVAGLHNTSYLERMGADRVVDRFQPQNAIAEARRLHVKFGVDCVGQQTAAWALQALQPGGRLACLVKAPHQDTIAASNVEVTDILIKRFHENALYGQSLMDYISSSLASGALRPVRYQRISGGLESLEKGLEKLKKETVSGEKVVVTIEQS